MDWLRQHMRDHIADFALPTEKVVSFRSARSISADNNGTAALRLVRQAADLLRSAEDHSAEIEARAQALADRAVEELRDAKKRIHSLESDCERLTALVAEAKDQALTTEDALRQSEARVAAMATQLSTAERCASSAERRASEAEGLLMRVEDAIRTEILEPHRSTSLTVAA
jgi:chromosome segregation ATPase